VKKLFNGRTNTLTASLLIAVFLVIISATSVSAAVCGFLTESRDGSLHQYDYRALLDSYALKVIGLSNGLFEDFYGKTPKAFIYEGGCYLDYYDLLNQYQIKVLKGQKFDLSAYAQSAGAKRFEPQSNIILVSVEAGKVVRTAVENEESNIKDQLPERLAGQQIDQAAPVGVYIPPAPVNDPAPAASQEPAIMQSTTPLMTATIASMAKAQAWATGNNAHQRFVDVATFYWEYGRLTGINPEVLYAQAAYETGFGHFGGLVPADYNNWGGIKTAVASGNNPEDYEQFAAPEEGVRAHFNHISAYIGVSPVGEPHGRYYVIAKMPWAGTVKTLEELSGKWAPSAAYHERIVAMVNALRN
jgi:hypothetical protein